MSTTTKLLCLDNTFMEVFRRKLSGGIVLGNRLSQRGLIPCTLAVWVHDYMTSIKPSDLDHDFADYERPLPIRDDLFALLDAHLRRPGAIVTADTSWVPSDPRPASFQDLVWFTCEPHRAGKEREMFAALDASRAGPQAYELLLREASPYSTVLTLTTLPPEMAFHSGDYMDTAQLDALLDRVERILVGAFDERSMILWSSVAAGAAGSPCPEIR